MDFSTNDLIEEFNGTVMYVSLNYELSLKYVNFFANCSFKYTKIRKLKLNGSIFVALYFILVSYISLYY